MKYTWEDPAVLRMSAEIHTGKQLSYILGISSVYILCVCPLYMSSVYSLVILQSTSGYIPCLLCIILHICMYYVATGGSDFLYPTIILCNDTVTL